MEPVVDSYLAEQIAHGHFHAVRFYESAHSLGRVVCGFLTGELRAGRPALIVANPRHRDVILRQLAVQFEVAALEADRMLRVLDSRETLARFMIDGVPNPERFEAAISSVLDGLAGAPHTPAAVYGEMVDMLWLDGLQMAALRLESLWNRLADQRRFSLLCGYAMARVPQLQGLARIRAAHTHEVSLSGTATRLTP